MIIPAIDIYKGKVVRLRQGKFNEISYYDINPRDLIEKYSQLNSKLIHIVDLSGAENTQNHQRDLITSFSSISKSPIQFGGGIRQKEDINTLLNNGINKIVLGSKAINDREFLKDCIKKFGKEKITLAVDVYYDQVKDSYFLATNGWKNKTKINIFNFLSECVSFNVKNVLCTDISRDGMMEGPNLRLYKELVLKYPQIIFQASGGTSSVKDLSNLKNVGIENVIVGKALLDGNIPSKNISGESIQC